MRLSADSRDQTPSAELRSIDHRLGDVVAAARKIERGCACGYDYRCDRCDAVIALQAALAEMDVARCETSSPSAENAAAHPKTPERVVREVPDAVPLAAPAVGTTHDDGRAIEAACGTMILPPTRIRSEEDVRGILEQLQVSDALQALHFGHLDHVQLLMLVSELTQNVIDHADAPGTIAASIDSATLSISVADEGRGFSGSLGINDAEQALWAAVVENRSRVPGPGRGHGILQTRKRVRQWGGSIRFQSGTAVLQDTDGRSCQLASGPDVPGVRVSIQVPARLRICP